jgi:hypothetical protein
MSPELEACIAQTSIENAINMCFRRKIQLSVRLNFKAFAEIRKAFGHKLNQAFDPEFTKFGPNDFWVSANLQTGELRDGPIAMAAMRVFHVDDFFEIIQDQSLWFGEPRKLDPRFHVYCEIPPFGGVVGHCGSLWVHPHYRGSKPGVRLSSLLPRYCRAIAIRNFGIEHDTGMIRTVPRTDLAKADRKARFTGTRVYGYARVEPFCDGWFAPDKVPAIVHLAHSTRHEALVDLATRL